MTIRRFLQHKLARFRFGDFSSAMDQQWINSGIRPVAVVQILFGVLCLCFQISLLILDDDSPHSDFHVFTSVAIGLFGIAAGCCGLAHGRKWLRSLYLAMTVCALVHCIFYVIATFWQIWLAIQTALGISLTLDHEETDQETNYWMFSLLVFSIIVQFVFAIAGISILVYASCSSSNKEATQRSEMVLFSPEAFSASKGSLETE